MKDIPEVESVCFIGRVSFGVGNVTEQLKASPDTHISVKDDTVLIRQRGKTVLVPMSNVAGLCPVPSKTEAKKA